MKNSSENIFKRLEELKAQFYVMQNDAEKNPEEFAKYMGFDLTGLKEMTPEEIKQKFEYNLNDLSKVVKGMNESILNKENPDSQAIENYYQKVKSQKDGPTDEDLQKMLGFFSKYVQSETENTGKSCFHYNKSVCDKKIIDAHSLQKGGALKNIASAKNDVIFIKKDGLNNNRKPVLIKTVNASTFKGFCHKHDTIFQQTIESEPFNCSDEHCFLHSYRSFAYSHHNVKQHQDYSISLIENLESALSKSSNALSELFIELGGNSSLPVQSLDKLKLNDKQKHFLSVTRYESYKNELNKNLAKESYDLLEYFVYTKDHIIPVACSSWIKSHLKFGHGLLVENNGNIYHGYPIMVTIVPESKGKSHVILARFKSDSISEILFRQLKDLKQKNIREFETTLSSMVLRYIENLYSSPEWWENLDSFLKDFFLKEMNLWDTNFMKMESTQEVINLFDAVYKQGRKKA